MIALLVVSGLSVALLAWLMLLPSLAPEACHKCETLLNGRQVCPVCRIPAARRIPAIVRHDVLKRAFDIVGAAVLLVLVSPLWLFIAAAIRLGTGEPVYFRQQRVGRDGKPFYCIKFRSMRVNAEPLLKADPTLYRRYVENGFKLLPEEDPRITRIGRFLRKTSLDELPQLINVLRGEMSLVGPRPILQAELERHYGARARLLLLARPGMTGAWAVAGRSEIGYPERIWIELDYVRSWSLVTDLKILFRTARIVVAGKGAY